MFAKIGAEAGVKNACADLVGEFWGTGCVGKRLRRVVAKRLRKFLPSLGEGISGQGWWEAPAKTKAQAGLTVGLDRQLSRVRFDCQAQGWSTKFLKIVGGRKLRQVVGERVSKSFFAFALASFFRSWVAKFLGCVGSLSFATRARKKNLVKFASPLFLFFFGLFCPTRDS